MSFQHADKMHNELGEQGISAGDCFATSLDSILPPDKDLPDGFYYDLVAARNVGDVVRYEGLIKQQIIRNFRADHPVFHTVVDLGVYCAPDGDPLQWGEPTDKYEVVPEEFRQLISDFPGQEWERVYGIRDYEPEAERHERADSALEDAFEKLGMFIVARNMILDGVSLMPLAMQSETETHVFAVTHNGLDDIHIVDTTFTPDGDDDSFRPLVRSSHLSLPWLCELEGDIEELPESVNEHGYSFPRITNSNIPIASGSKWKYAVHPFPPSK